jgi:hypothetical protein
MVLKEQPCNVQALQLVLRDVLGLRFQSEAISENFS